MPRPKKEATHWHLIKHETGDLVRHADKQALLDDVETCEPGSFVIIANGEEMTIAATLVPATAAPPKPPRKPRAKRTAVATWVDKDGNGKISTGDVAKPRIKVKPADDSVAE